jgi:hypothetical protein
MFRPQQNQEVTAKGSKEKKKRRLEKIAFVSFILSTGAAGWFLLALIGDLINARQLFIPLTSLVPPIIISLIMYVCCKYAQKRANAIVTEREEEQERLRQERIAAAMRGLRPTSDNSKPNEQDQRGR